MDLNLWSLAQTRELVAIDHILPNARRVEQPNGRPGPDRAVSQRVMPEHGHERRDSRPAGDKEQGSTLRDVPDEIPADGSAQLEAVARVKHVAQIGRHFAIVQSLDGERDRPLLRR